MRRLLVIVAAALALSPLGVVAAESQTAQWLFLKLSVAAGAQADAAARAGRRQDAKTWADWSLLYRQDVVSPGIEGKSALQITDELADGTRKIAATSQDPRAAALFRASADFWARLHQELASGAPLAVSFPREMLTPVPGLKGTPWQPGVFATAADCAQLAQRARFCESQAGQMAHENTMGMYGDRSFPLLMQEHSCHKWEEMRTAYCAGRF